MGQTFRMEPAAPTACPDGVAVVATCQGIAVPGGPALSPEMVRSLQDGSFAAALLRAALAAVLPGDRVLHLGAGPGVVAAVIARSARPAAILSVERDAGMAAQARTLFRHNGLEEVVTLRHGQVRAGHGPDGSPEPALAASGGLPEGVPVLCHDRLRRTHPHNVIVLDHLGAEHAFLRQATLSGVRLVLAALQPGPCGREHLHATRRALCRAGYERDLGLSDPGVDVWRRVRV